MSDRVEWYAITIPAGTLKTALLTFPCVFQQGEVVEIDIIVPDGCNGAVGFFVGAGGSQYVPRTNGSFVVANGEYIVWPLSNGITSGSWSVTGYNTDLFDHTLQVSFRVNEVGPTPDNTGQPIGGSSAGLSSALSDLPSTPIVPADPLSPDALIASLPSEAAMSGVPQ